VTFKVNYMAEGGLGGVGQWASQIIKKNYLSLLVLGVQIYPLFLDVCALYFLKLSLCHVIFEFYTPLYMGLGKTTIYPFRVQ
jgi:hypothetical protein